MKRIFLIAGILAALVLAAVVSLPFVIDANHFRPMLESKLSEALGRQVRLGGLKLGILHGAVAADDFSVADDPAYSHAPFIQAKSLNIGVDLWQLFASRKLNVTRLAIDRPRVALIQSPSGEWNFSNLGGRARAGKRFAVALPIANGPAQPIANRPAEVLLVADRSAQALPAASRLGLSVKLVTITGGQFSLDRTGGAGRPQVFEQVDAEVRDFSSTSVFPFSLSAKVAGGGDIKLEGQAGPVYPADVAMTPASASLKVTQLDLAGSGFIRAAPALAGLISFEGSAETNGKTAHANGRLKAEKVKLAAGAAASGRPVEFDFAVEHNLKARAGRLRQGDIHIGGASAYLTGTYAAQGDSMLVKMNLAGSSMPVPELAAMLPALGIVLPAGASLEGGTADIQFVLEGALQRMVTSGSLAFSNTRLVGFSLSRNMEAIQTLAGIRGAPDTDIQTLSASLKIASDGMRANDVQLVVPAIGNLQGGGTVSPGNLLDFKMRARLHTAALATGISDASIPFLITGTAAQPVFQPDIKAIVNEKAKGFEGTAEETAGRLLKGLLGGKKN